MNLSEIISKLRIAADSGDVKPSTMSGLIAYLHVRLDMADEQVLALQVSNSTYATENRELRARVLQLEAKQAELDSQCEYCEICSSAPGEPCTGPAHTRNDQATCENCQTRDACLAVPRKTLLCYVGDKARAAASGAFGGR